VAASDAAGSVLPVRASGSCRGFSRADDARRDAVAKTCYGVTARSASPVGWNDASTTSSRPKTASADGAPARVPAAVTSPTVRRRRVPPGPRRKIATTVLVLAHADDGASERGRTPRERERRKHAEVAALADPAIAAHPPSGRRQRRGAGPRRPEEDPGPRPGAPDGGRRKEPARGHVAFRHEGDRNVGQAVHGAALQLDGDGAGRVDARRADDDEPGAERRAAPRTRDRRDGPTVGEPLGLATARTRDEHGVGRPVGVGGARGVVPEDPQCAVRREHDAIGGVVGESAAERNPAGGVDPDEVRADARERSAADQIVHPRHHDGRTGCGGADDDGRCRSAVDEGDAAGGIDRKGVVLETICSARGTRVAVGGDSANSAAGHREQDRIAAAPPTPDAPDEPGVEHHGAVAADRGPPPEPVDPSVPGVPDGRERDARPRTVVNAICPPSFRSLARTPVAGIGVTTPPLQR